MSFIQQGEDFLVVGLQGGGDEGIFDLWSSCKYMSTFSGIYVNIDCSDTKGGTDAD